MFLKQTLLLCYHFIMNSQTEKPQNKIPNLNIRDSYEKIMRARYRKRKKKLKSKTGNSTRNMSATASIASKMDILTEELFLTKQSEKQLINETSNLKNLLQKCTENTRLREEIFIKLKNEKEMLESQIQTNQAEIAHLNQEIKDKTKMLKKEHEIETKITNYQKDIAHLTKIIEKQKEGKLNPNELKIKQLNIQLRQQRLVVRNLSNELETCKKILQEKTTENSKKQSNGNSA